MNIHEFVHKKIADNKTRDLIHMIDTFAEEQANKRHDDYKVAYNFLSMFLIAVKSQLRYLQPGQPLASDHILATWQSLGFVGIDWLRIGDLEE